MDEQLRRIPHTQTFYFVSVLCDLPFIFYGRVHVSVSMGTQNAAYFTCLNFHSSLIGPQSYSTRLLFKWYRKSRSQNIQWPRVWTLGVIWERPSWSYVMGHCWGFPIQLENHRVFLFTQLGNILGFLCHSGYVCLWAVYLWALGNNHKICENWNEYGRWFEDQNVGQWPKKIQKRDKSISVIGEGEEDIEVVRAVGDYLWREHTLLHLHFHSKIPQAEIGRYCE